MSSKYISAPWIGKKSGHWQQPNDDWSIECEGRSGLTWVYVTNESGNVIAIVPAKGHSPNIVEARATLIAAAPDLLDALQGLFSAIGGEGSTDIFCANARAAIAKATGEAA